MVGIDDLKTIFEKISAVQVILWAQKKCELGLRPLA